MATKDHLWAEYEALGSTLDLTSETIRELIVESISELGDPYIVRTRLTELRVKSFESCWRKIEDTPGYDCGSILEIPDLIGIRVVCANLEDMPRIREVIGNIERVSLKVEDERDYVQTPRESGYRALHLCGSFKLLHNRTEVEFPCEIQIRTNFQDSWATLTHQDIYKDGEHLPAEIKRLTLRLSEVLVTADNIAGDIREFVSQLNRVEEKPTGDGLSEAVVAFIYRRMFEEDCPAYLIAGFQNMCKEHGVLRADAIERVALDPGARVGEQIREAYEGETNWGCDNSVVFRLLPVAVSEGLEAAVREAKKMGERHWQEVDAVYRSELSAEIPDTYNDFIETLNPQTKHDIIDLPYSVSMYAEFFDSKSECSRCGTPVVDEEGFADAAQQHYGVDGQYEVIQERVINSGVETAQEMGMCAYCHHVWSKD